MESIQERINLIKKELKFSSDGKFADFLGFGRSNYSQYMNGNRTIGESIINKICIHANINKTWLLTGEGAMFIKVEPPTPPPPPEQSVDMGRILLGYLSQQETIATLTQKLSEQIELVKAKQEIINDLSERLRVRDADLRFKENALKELPTDSAGGGNTERQAG